MITNLRFSSSISSSKTHTQALVGSKNLVVGVKFIDFNWKTQYNTIIWYDSTEKLKLAVRYLDIL